MPRVPGSSLSHERRRKRGEVFVELSYEDILPRSRRRGARPGLLARRIFRDCGLRVPRVNLSHSHFPRLNIYRYNRERDTVIGREGGRGEGGREVVRNERKLNRGRGKVKDEKEDGITGVNHVPNESEVCLFALICMKEKKKTPLLRHKYFPASILETRNVEAPRRASAHAIALRIHESRHTLLILLLQAPPQATEAARRGDQEITGLRSTRPRRKPTTGLSVVLDDVIPVRDGAAAAKNARARGCASERFPK